MRMYEAIEHTLNNTPLKRGKRTLSANTKARMEDGTLIIRYFDTDIIRYDPDTFTMTTTCGGWATQSTLERIRAAVHWWNVHSNARLGRNDWRAPRISAVRREHLALHTGYAGILMPADSVLVLAPAGVTFARPDAEIPAALALMRSECADRTRNNKPDLMYWYGHVLRQMVEEPDAQRALPVSLTDVLRVLQEEIADREARPRLPRKGGRR